MSFEFLQSIIDNDESNYKYSGLPKFKKYKSTIFTKQPSTTPPRCITSIDELYTTLYDNYGAISINNIINLYIDHDIIVSESIVVNLPVTEIHKYREYDRSKQLYCSKRTPDQFDSLVEDIKINGIVHSGRIRIDRITPSTIGIILGEGNHRLSIAAMLGINTMPIVFRYLL